MNILIIDDEMMVLQGLNKLLCTARPHDNIVCFGEPCDALHYVQQNHVDIVISDVQMPQMNGLELCQRIRALTDAKIIIISGYDDFNYAVSALQLGAVHYILKPIKQHVLLDTLEKTIQQQQQERSEHTAALTAQRIQLQSLLCQLANGIPSAIPDDILSDYRIGLLCFSAAESPFAPEQMLLSAVSGCKIAGFGEYRKNQFIFALTGAQAAAASVYGAMQTALEKQSFKGSFALSRVYSDAKQLSLAVLQAELQLERLYWKKKQLEDEADLVIRVNELLAADCANASLQHIAAQLGFNAAYFSTLFKKKAGVSFKDHLFDYKILRARQLLRSTDLLVSDISVSLGYQNSDHFSRAFRECVGVSPSVFRAQCESERNEAT